MNIFKNLVQILH